MASTGEFDKAVESFLSIVNSDESRWTFTHEKRGVKVYTSADPNSAVSVLRGQGTVAASADDIATLLSDVTKRGSWDVFYESGSIVKWLSEGEIGIGHLKFKGYGFAVWPRDFSVIAGKRKLAEGSWVCVATSVLTPEVPEVSGYVRAKIMESGFLIKPSAADPTKSELTYIVQVELGGWIPSAVTNMVNSYQPLGIIGIRKILTGKSE